MPIEIELEAPICLIAVPQLGDPNFSRAVVLIVEHNEQGSMGLIINRPTAVEVGVFCRDQELVYQGDGAQPVYLGGPVQTDRAFILHAPGFEGPETDHILAGVRLSYSLESLAGIAAKPPDGLRILIGYAGWGPDQLATEISEGAWLVTEATEALVFETEAEEIWEQALAQIGVTPLQLMQSSAMH